MYLNGNFRLNVSFQLTDVVTVRDVADVHVGEIRHDNPVVAEDDFEVTVFLNNTGNVEKDIIVNLTILNDSLALDLIDQIQVDICTVKGTF